MLCSCQLVINQEGENMSSKKSMQNEKMLKGVRKRGAKSVGQNVLKAGQDKSLREQYDLIRDDLIKLKQDIQKGYSMAKVAVEKKKIFDQFLKSR